jgi:hypothetical protein
MDAKSMRRFIFEYIESNWYNISFINGMKWSDAITIQHNSCVTEEERLLYGVWDADETLRLNSCILETRTT